MEHVHAHLAHSSGPPGPAAYVIRQRGPRSHRSHTIDRISLPVRNTVPEYNPPSGAIRRSAAIDAYLTKTEHATQALRQAIDDGSLQPGDWIRLRVWADRLGLSVTPVREAVHRLEVDGVVSIHAHRGVQGAGYSAADLVEGHRARLALETLAVELIVEKLSRTEREALAARLRPLAARFDATGEDPEHTDTASANREFHMQLYAAAASPKIQQMIENLWSYYGFQRGLTISNRAVAQAAHEHHDLLDRIVAGDTAAIRRLLSRHILAAVRPLLKPAAPDGRASED